jgi:hypothetical protein
VPISNWLFSARYKLLAVKRQILGVTGTLGGGCRKRGYLSRKTSSNSSLSTHVPAAANEVSRSAFCIDGLRDHMNVSRDFYHFESRVAVGGYVAFHDCAPIPGRDDVFESAEIKTESDDQPRNRRNRARLGK